MAITGISAISGEQIIAAGAVSAREAATASFTTGGNDIQNLYDTVSTNSASWTASGPSYTGDAQGALDEVYSNSADWNSAAAMNELPVSAGEGMDIQNVDGNIVFSCTGGSVPEGVLVESGLEYNANNEISGYSGSAFAQPSISAAEWNSNYETVNTNSGAWGGDALPISAGPGIKVELTDGKLLFSTDETVLYSGTAQTSAITFSEPLTAFERILVAAGQVSVGNWGYTYLTNGGSNTYYAGFTRFIGGNNPVQIGGCILNVNSQHTSGNLNPCGRHWFPTTTAAGGGDTNQFYFTKVIGINHTAGGN